MGDFIYDLMSTVFHPAMVVMDWSMNQHPVVAVGAILLTSAAYLAVAAAPFLIKAHFNAKAMERTLEALDQRPTEAFRVAADEKSYNHFQQRAVEAAEKIGRKMGNGLSYGSFDSCAANHASFDKTQTPIYTTTMVGKTPITTFVGYSTSYHPRIVGYQAATDTPEIAVPLYSSIHADKGYRQDGKLIDLKMA